MTKLSTALIRAQAADAETKAARKELIAQLRHHIAIDHEGARRLEEADRSFARKLKSYPSDLTISRLCCAATFFIV